MISTYYPILIALAAVMASAVLSERALALLEPTPKANLVDTFARTRLVNLGVIAIFLALVLWRPPFAWVFLGCAFLVVGARSMLRLRRLKLPESASRLLLASQILAVGGIVACALIYAVRSRP